MNNKIKVFLKGIVLPLISHVVISFLVVFIMVVINIICIVIDYYKNNDKILDDVNYIMDKLYVSDGFLTNSIVMTGVAAIIFFLIFYFKNYNKFLLSIKFEENKFDIKNLKNVLMLSFGSSLFFNIILLYILPFTQNNEKVIKMSEEIYNMNIFLAIFIVSIIIPLTEELLMRGYIFNSLRYIFNDYVGIILSALLFGIIHGNITQGIYAFFVGIMLAAIYRIYKNLKYCFIFHILANFFITLLGPAMMLTDFIGKMFLLLISFAIMVLSIYKIYLDYKNDII